MRTVQVSNMDDVIDSRDVITRIEELQNNGPNERRIEHPDIAPSNEDAEELAELDALRELAEQGEGSPDWPYGETLINDDYFVEYIKELIDDCYEVPTSTDWPYRHMQIDYEAAAEEVKQDYMSVSFDGIDYWIQA